MDVNAALQREIAGEQSVTNDLYSRLDEVRERTSTELEHARNDITTGTPASRVEREAFVRMYADRYAALLAAERQQRREERKLGEAHGRPRLLL
jgi:hypothetical protein